MKYARLREEAQRMFGGVRGLAKAAGVNHSNIFKVIKGDYPANEDNIKRAIEQAVLKEDPGFAVERLWDMTSHYVKHELKLGKPVIMLDDVEFDLIAVYKKRDNG
jgi:hypothetical protein